MPFLGFPSPTTNGNKISLVKCIDHPTKVKGKNQGEWQNIILHHELGFNKVFQIPNEVWAELGDWKEFIEKIGWEAMIFVNRYKFCISAKVASA